MRCLSIQQPFASLIALHAKSIETRSRDFTGGYRGPLAIHASKGKDYMHLCSKPLFSDALEHSGATIEQGICYYDGWHLPMGAIVAVADLEDVVKTSDLESNWKVIWPHVNKAWPRCMLPGQRTIQERTKTELVFGDYTPGRYMLLLSNVVALPSPIPAKGRLGLWEFEMEDPRGGKNP